MREKYMGSVNALGNWTLAFGLLQTQYFFSTISTTQAKWVYHGAKSCFWRTKQVTKPSRSHTNYSELHSYNIFFDFTNLRYENLIFHHNQHHSTDCIQLSSKCPLCRPRATRCRNLWLYSKGHRSGSEYNLIIVDRLDPEQSGERPEFPHWRVRPTQSNYGKHWTAQKVGSMICKVPSANCRRSFRLLPRRVRQSWRPNHGLSIAA
jgi:hypothetical protein